MSDESKLRAVRAAAARHRLKTSGAIEGKKKPGAGFSSLERAYLIECIANTIRIGEITPGDAWFLGRSIFRLVDGQFGFLWMPRLLQLIAIPCAVCGRRSTRRVGMIGFCRDHRTDATIDRERKMRLANAGKEERHRLIVAQEKHIEAARKHHRAKGSLMAPFRR